MTFARDELRARVRRGERLSVTSTVLRGGPDTPSLLTTHARRLARAHLLDGDPVYGVSVFVALDDIGPASEHGILRARLRSYPLVYRTSAAALMGSRFDLLATFGRPHYTVVLPSLAAVGSLLDVLGEPEPNPYAGGGKEGR